MLLGRPSAPHPPPPLTPAFRSPSPGPPAGERLKQLIALRTSPRYLDRMAAGLQQKAGQEAKFLRWAGAEGAVTGELAAP